jgi:hypothetical protein
MNDHETKLFLPSGKQVQEVLNYLDIAIKFEIALNSFHTIIMSTCLLEAFIMVVIFGFFLRAPTSMFYFILHTPHIARAIIGFQISNKCPYS